MSRVAFLKIINGNFEQGFDVLLQVWTDNASLLGEIRGKLPANTELEEYTLWRDKFIRLRTQRGIDDDWQMENIPSNRSTSEVDECYNLVQKLETSMKNWLLRPHDEGWQRIRERFAKELADKSDEFRVIITVINSLLYKLPWHTWDLIERNPDVEIALSYPNNGELELLETNHNNQVRILAILGESSGIDTEPDQNAIRQLNAEAVFLPQPTARTLITRLREERWNIFFFAGHSQTYGEIGRIYINATESLEISRFKNALREAIRNGLKIAIFNSCDGLGLAQDLAHLRIPFTIVMREPVPDEVAQSFLKEFLTEYANGRSLYTSVRRARESLEKFQDFPGATWLPVICQNPAEVPPTWQELRRDPVFLTQGNDDATEVPQTRQEVRRNAVFLTQGNDNAAQVLRKQKLRHPQRKGQILSGWQSKLTMLILLSVVVVLVLVGINTTQVQSRNINSIYQEILGRDADSAEIAGRTFDLAKGMTLSQMRGEIAHSEEVKNKINSIYQQVLERDADSEEITERISDLAKDMTLSALRDDIARRQEAKDKINHIYYETLGRDVEDDEQKFLMNLLATKKSLSSIRSDIARTYSLLEDGNVISLKCLGHIAGSRFLYGSAGSEPVALVAVLSSSDPGTQWKIHRIDDGVIALENLGKIANFKWLDGETLGGKVKLSPSTGRGYTGTKWRIYVMNDGVISLKNLGELESDLRWLDGETPSGKVKLSPSTEGDYTGTKWQIIEPDPMSL